MTRRVEIRHRGGQQGGNPPPPATGFVARKGVSYFIHNDSDGTTNGSPYEWYGWDISSQTHVLDDFPWIASASLWVEWRRIETSLGVFNWGLQHQADPTLGLVHYAFERAYANGQQIILRLPTGHWCPDFIIGDPSGGSGLVPSAGLTVNGDGVTPLRMPVVFHPNYRTHLARFWAGVRAFLNTTYPDGSTYASRVLAMPMDAASAVGVEWSTSTEGAGVNPTAMDTAVTTWGGVALNANGSAFGIYPRGAGDTSTNVWKADAYAQQWLWGLQQWVPAFPDVQLVVAMGQMFADADLHELAWTDPAQLNLFGGANAGHVVAMRTNWSPTGSDNVPSSWLAWGGDPTKPLVQNDRTALRNVRAAGGRVALQSASTTLFPLPRFGSGSSTEWGILSDLEVNWPDMVFFECAPLQIANSVLASELQGLQAQLGAPPTNPTPPPPLPPPPAPTIAGEPASGVTDTAATLNGLIDTNGANTIYNFLWGTTSAYGNSTPTELLLAGNVPVAVSAQLTGLVAGTVYHWSLVAQSGQVIATSDDTFTTQTPPPPPPPPPPAAPIVTSGAVSGIGQTTANLTGTVDPGTAPTSWRFEYGTTSSYGSTAPMPDGAIAAGSGPTAVAASLSGLAAGTTYHYRLSATNAGGTSVTSDGTFTTATPPPPPPPPPPLPDTSTGKVYLTAALQEWGNIPSAGVASSWSAGPPPESLVTGQAGSTAAGGAADHFGGYADKLVAATTNGPHSAGIYFKSVQYQGTDYSFPESWYAHSDAAGTVRVTVPNYPSVFVMQPDSTEAWNDTGGVIGPVYNAGTGAGIYHGFAAWQAQYIKHTLQTKNAGYGALSLSPFNVAWCDSAGTDSLINQVVPGTNTKYTAATWLPLVNKLLDTIRAAQVTSTLVFANGLASNGALVSHADGVMVENWLRAAGAGALPGAAPTDVAWTSKLQLVMDAQASSGRYVQVYTKLWDYVSGVNQLSAGQTQAWARFFVASYLLGNLSKLYGQLAVDETTNPWNVTLDAAFGVNLLTPKQTFSTITQYRASALTSGGYVYERIYRRGVVLLNTASSGITVTLDRSDYKELDGSAAPQTYTVPRQSGVILTAATG